MKAKNKVVVLIIEKFMAFIKSYHLKFEEGVLTFKK